MLRVVLLIISTIAPFSLYAAPKNGLVTDDYLKCAAHYAAWSYLLKSNGYGKKDELKGIEERVRYYIQIATAIENKPLKERFMSYYQEEMEKAQTLIKSGKSDMYFNYADNKKQDCALLVKNNQSEIMKALTNDEDKHTNRFPGMTEKRYKLPNHGTLLLNVPKEWQDQVSYPPEDLPPTIRFTQKTGEKFVILFTLMWKMPGAHPDFGTTQFIKNMVEGAALKVSTQAEEKQIKVKELAGSNIGYYFSVTDKAPKPGEYKYMSQGVIGVNEIMGTFTILTNSSNSEIVEHAIKMFGSLKHAR